MTAKFKICIFEDEEHKHSYPYAILLDLSYIVYVLDACILYLSDVYSYLYLTLFHKNNIPVVDTAQRTVPVPRCQGNALDEYRN